MGTSGQLYLLWLGVTPGCDFNGINCNFSTDVEMQYKSLISIITKGIREERYSKKVWIVLSWLYQGCHQLDRNPPRLFCHQLTQLVQHWAVAVYAVEK
jgi:hypothetical protein